MSDIQLTEYGPMSGSYLRAKLSDLCVDKIGVQTGPFGSQLHKEDYVEVGTSIITVEHLGDNRIIHQDTPYVSDEDKNRLSKYHLQEGDIVFSRVGSVDRRALVRKDEDGWLFSGRCLRVRVDKSKIDPVYLSYFFGLESFKNYIRSIAVGATMPSINTKILSDVPIYYPEDLDEQRRIAEVFYTNDEKIELNRQINQTLEQIAQAIFKSWFVDFEPVKAKIEAKQNGQDPERAAMRAISGKTDEQLDQLNPEQRQQLTTTAALFPDELEDSELGKIPKGWAVNTIDDVTSHIIDHRGKTPKKLGGDWVDEGYPSISAKNIKNGRIINHENIRYVDKELYHRWMKEELEAGDILLTSEGPMGEMYFLSTDEKYCLSQRLYGIRADGKHSTPVYLYLWLNSAQAKADLEGRATGTTVVGIRQSELRKVKVLSPPFSVLNTFESITKDLFNNLHLNEKESISLSGVRDALLPKLLSSEVNFSDTQSTAVAVA